MKKGKPSGTNLWSALLLLIGVGVLNGVNAQPTDAKIKRDLMSPKTVSITLGKPGKVEWSSTYKKYVWTRNFTVKLKTDDPAIFLIVKGYASYDVIGGRYAFWRTFTSSNSYEGLPDPTNADLQGLIAKLGMQTFIREYYLNKVIGRVESFTLSDEPKYEWHTLNSVSFNAVAIYTARTNDVGGRERVAHTFRVRLYRDNPKAEWRNAHSSDLEKTPL